MTLRPVLPRSENDVAIEREGPSIDRAGQVIRFASGVNPYRIETGSEPRLEKRALRECQRLACAIMR